MLLVVTITQWSAILRTQQVNEMAQALSRINRLRYSLCAWQQGTHMFAEAGTCMVWWLKAFVLGVLEQKRECHDAELVLVSRRHVRLKQTAMYALRRTSLHAICMQEAQEHIQNKRHWHMKQAVLRGLAHNMVSRSFRRSRRHQSAAIAGVATLGKALSTWAQYVVVTRARDMRMQLSDLCARKRALNQAWGVWCAWVFRKHGERTVRQQQRDRDGDASRRRPEALGTREKENSHAASDDQAQARDIGEKIRYGDLHHVVGGSSAGSGSGGSVGITSSRSDSSSSSRYDRRDGDGSLGRCNGDGSLGRRDGDGGSAMVKPQRQSRGVHVYQAGAMWDPEMAGIHSYASRAWALHAQTRRNAEKMHVGR
jgi:hypothetical protein